jgi:hypothetical protein
LSGADDRSGKPQAGLQTARNGVAWRPFPAPLLRCDMDYPFVA